MSDDKPKRKPWIKKPKEAEKPAGDSMTSRFAKNAGKRYAHKMVKKES